jgi:hypothetical protein
VRRANDIGDRDGAARSFPGSSSNSIIEDLVKMTRAILVGFVLLAGATAVHAQTREPAPVKVTLADFRKLKFLEGKWRGTGYRVPFFESYRFVNDSTIEGKTSEDSRFTTTKPGSNIVLRGGSIYSQDIGQPPRWAVTRIDTAGYYFSALGRPGFFIWKSVNPNEWSAVLQGGTVYRMYRLE